MESNINLLTRGKKVQYLGKSNFVKDFLLSSQQRSVSQPFLTRGTLF